MEQFILTKGYKAPGQPLEEVEFKEIARENHMSELAEAYLEESGIEPEEEREETAEDLLRSYRIYLETCPKAFISEGEYTSSLLSKDYVRVEYGIKDKSTPTQSHGHLLRFRRVIENAGQEH